VTVKRGHALVKTTLRPDEVTILDEYVAEQEAARQKRARSSATYRPATDGMKFHRAGVVRAAIRYVLEHRTEFEQWLASDKDPM